jgi:acetylornithine deacetylase/succinyl-diaminopimelate desuccinylase-like protein
VAAHRGQPFLGINAFDKMIEVASAIKSDLEPKLRRKFSKYPVEPPEGRYPTLCLGGIATCGTKINVVPDKSMFTAGRRLIPEESLEDAINEINLVIERLRKGDPKLKVDVKKVMTVDPATLSADHHLVKTVKNIVQEVSGREPKVFVDAASDDRKFLMGAKIPAIAYGPGLATGCHVADEYCDVSDLMVATKVLALTVLDLLG